MTRTMYDSVNPSAIPTTAAMVAGYVDGRYAWTAADWARFPGAVKVRIAVFPSTNDGHVLDCETGDATPAQCPGWVQMRRAAGVDPTVYCAQSQWATVQSAFTAAGVAQPHYWVAAYPGAGAGTIPAGAVAHQYADPATSGGDWDLSAVVDYWPGVDPAPSNGGFLMALTDAQALTVYEAADSLLPGQAGVRFAGPLFLMLQSMQTQIAAIPGALAKEEAELLAAVKEAPAATVDPGAVAKALTDAGLPAEVASAFVALLTKAAG